MATMSKPKGSIFKLIGKMVLAIIGVFVLLLIVARIYLSTGFVYRYIDGNSMEPTFSGSAGEYHYLYMKKIKTKTKIKRFDIVALHHGKNTDWIKRVVGLPNETIRYTDGLLYVNNQFIKEPFVSESYFNNELNKEIVLKENQYFVIGDNRKGSADDIVDFSSIYAINGFVYKTCTMPGKNGMGILEKGCKITYKKIG